MLPRTSRKLAPQAGCQASLGHGSTLQKVSRRKPLPYPAMPLAEAHRRLTAPGSQFEVSQAEVRGESMRVWKNAPPTLRDVFRAGRSFGPKTFLVYEDERATFEGFARAT